MRSKTAKCCIGYFLPLKRSVKHITDISTYRLWMTKQCIKSFSSKVRRVQIRGSASKNLRISFREVCVCPSVCQSVYQSIIYISFLPCLFGLCQVHTDCSTGDCLGIRVQYTHRLQYRRLFRYPCAVHTQIAVQEIV